MYSDESGLGIAPAVIAGAATKILGGIFGKPVSETEQLRRNQVAYELAITGDNDALAFLKARGNITKPISNNMLAKQFGSTDGYVGNQDGKKYPKVGPDAKAKATAIMGRVDGGTTMTSPLQPGQPAQAAVFGGISPVLGIALGLGLLLATRKGR